MGLLTRIVPVSDAKRRYRRRTRVEIMSGRLNDSRGRVGYNAEAGIQF